ncbi:succinylglutamate desuccinylase/aspartoacylase family protein [Niveispirillum fermenti]|uniref:succinylglutamate desuccinylase/aspartoacylase family protein n=1 Tax=Niveispirillum fermenti TaxID=1233113 RepID=UPI00404153EF
MTHQIDTIALPHGRPGTSRQLTIHQFGQPGARPKAYIQAGLHADELPGMLVARHLIDRLAALDGQGKVAGHVVLIPMANPIGLDQIIMGGHMGQFDLAGGVNFNRAFADLSDPVSARLAAGTLGPLSADPEANRRLLQAALSQAAGEIRTRTETEALRKLLLSHAVDADLVLDLHCDSEALMHLYTTPCCWPLGVDDLAARLDCGVALLAETSGGNPFDEVCSTPWDSLRRGHGGPATPIPVGCISVTVELRGQHDVDETMARRDADALIDHLGWRGILDVPAPAMAIAADIATPLAAVDRVRAPAGGVVLYHAMLGEQVQAGQHVACVLDPMTGTRHACHAASDGPVWARSRNRYACPGDILLSIAGREVLVTSGPLLTA